MTELLALAESMALEAGAELARRFSSTRSTWLKNESGTDLVTDADRASEARILARLAAEVPTHAVVAEEAGARDGREVTWFIDPLDGTVNYAHGIPHFCVSIGFSDAHGLAGGVVFDPLRNECFTAVRGGPARLNGASMRVSTVSSLREALFATGFPYDVHEHPERPLALLRRFVTQAQGLRRFGSAALDLAWVACGRFGGFFELGLKPWDIAAGAVLVEAAGGVVGAIDGSAFSERSGDLWACAPGLREQVCALCSESADES